MTGIARCSMCGRERWAFDWLILCLTCDEGPVQQIRANKGAA